MRMSDSIVVVPTYNEAENLPLLVQRVLATGDFHILVVDDGSPDGTGEVAERLAATHPGRVMVVHRQAKEGLGRAYVAGFKVALTRGYEYIFQMDADMSHDPAVLPALKQALETADVAIGSRYVQGGGTRGWPLRRRLLSEGGSIYSRLLLGVPVRDITGGFKAFRRRALEALDLDSVRARGFGFQIEVNYRLHRLGYRLVEVPFIFEDRRAGASKMSWPILLEALTLPWQLRLAELRRRRVPGARRGERRGLRAALASVKLVAGTASKGKNPA